MAARHFQELLAWQLSYELKCEVMAFTATGPASKDFKYRDQIRASSASGPSNIAEVPVVPGERQRLGELDDLIEPFA